MKNVSKCVFTRPPPERYGATRELVSGGESTPAHFLLRCRSDAHVQTPTDTHILEFWTDGKKIKELLTLFFTSLLVRGSNRKQEVAARSC